MPDDWGTGPRAARGGGTAAAPNEPRTAAAGSSQPPQAPGRPRVRPGVLVVVVVGVGLPRLQAVAHHVRPRQRLRRRRGVATWSSRSTTATPRRRSARRCTTTRWLRRCGHSSTPPRATPRSTSIQPGFYKVRTEIPASDAVARLTDPQNRVGKLVIPEGRQLDDIHDIKTNAVTDGIFTLISRATCVDLDGEQRCVSVDDLREAAASTSPSALSVPDWATKPVDAHGRRPPPARGPDRAGHLEHRPVGLAAGHPVHADRRQRRPVRAGRAAGHRKGVEHVAVPNPDGRVAGAA